jgi:hypothetical protein
MVTGAPSTAASNVLFGSFSEAATLVPSNVARRPMGPQLPAGLLGVVRSQRPKYWMPGGRPLPASLPLPEPPDDPDDELLLDPPTGDPLLDEDALDEPLPEEPPLADEPLPVPPEDVLPPEDQAPDPLPEPPSSPVPFVPAPVLEHAASRTMDVAMTAV